MIKRNLRRELSEARASLTKAAIEEAEVSLRYHRDKIETVYYMVVAKEWFFGTAIAAVDRAAELIYN